MSQEYAAGMKPLILLFACGLSAAATAETLTVGIGDQAFPPYKVGNDTLDPRRPGLSVELVLAAARSCRLKADIRLLPGARLLKALENNAVDTAMMLSYTADRAAYAVFPLRNGKPDEARRLATLSYSLYVRRDSDVRWDGKKLSNLQRSVGTNAGWSINKDLQKLGIPAETANSVEQNFDKLANKRIDAYAVHETLGDAYLASNPALPVRKLALPISTKPYFLPVSRRYAASHPRQVDCLWSAIAAQRDDLTRRRIRFYLDAGG
ncbi:ABC-type amino acid transport/signal transduction system, periplasmic component/domain [Chromobacterium violaceum]